jgi:outer membrane protein OmpA-like peptidoglycan-associated protein
MARYWNILFITLALHWAPVPAQEEGGTSHKDTLGFGIGALLGGLFAGPPGAVIGAAGGTILGNQNTKKDNAIDALEKKLHEKNIELAYLQNQMTNIQSDFAGALQKSRKENEHAAQRKFIDGISFSLYYRTGKADIEPDLIPHIHHMANLIREHQEINVQLEAHADFRGSRQYNMALSESRANAVEKELIRAGLKADRIRIYACGETHARAGKEDEEGYVFDRRVDVRLIPNTEI